MDKMTTAERERADELLAQWLPWLEYRARHAALAESRRFVAYTAGELFALPDAPPPVEFDRETAYRRGYWHGYSEAMDALVHAGAARGKAWQRVAIFYDENLTRWRYEPRPRISQRPPMFANGGRR